MGRRMLHSTGREPPDQVLCLAAPVHVNVVAIDAAEWVVFQIHRDRL